MALSIEYRTRNSPTRSDHSPSSSLLSGLPRRGLSANSPTAFSTLSCVVRSSFSKLFWKRLVSLSSAGTRFLEIPVECRIPAGFHVGLCFQKLPEEGLIRHDFHRFRFLGAQQDGAGPGTLGNDDPATLAHLFQEFPQVIAGFENTDYFIHIVTFEVYAEAYICVKVPRPIPRKPVKRIPGYFFGYTCPMMVCATRFSGAITLSIFFILGPFQAFADEVQPGILTGIGQNTLASFSGWNALCHVAGAGATWGMVESGVDYRVHSFFRGKQSLQYFLLPVGATGALGPLALGGYLYFKGSGNSDMETLGAGCAVLQANLITFTYISLLKAVTGRPNPDPEEFDDMREASRTFKWGFGRGGIFWGWPSGHTGATMATVSALTAYYPEKTWLKVGGYSFVAYTMAGVCAIGDGSMHWASDAVAGSFMAYAIGSSVGRGFRGGEEKQASKGIVPRIAFFPARGMAGLEWAI